MVQKVLFHSFWDGCQDICTKCKIETTTHEVFDIEPYPGNIEDLDFMICEYIEFDDGTLAPVVRYDGHEDERLPLFPDRNNATKLYQELWGEPGTPVEDELEKFLRIGIYWYNI